jgi:hypothetical protein
VELVDVDVIRLQLGEACFQALNKLAPIFCHGLGGQEKVVLPALKGGAQLFFAVCESPGGVEKIDPPSMARRSNATASFLPVRWTGKTPYPSLFTRKPVRPSVASNMIPPENPCCRTTLSLNNYAVFPAIVPG